MSDTPNFYGKTSEEILREYGLNTPKMTNSQSSSNLYTLTNNNTAKDNSEEKNNVNPDNRPWKPNYKVSEETEKYETKVIDTNEAEKLTENTNSNGGDAQKPGDVLLSIIQEKSKDLVIQKPERKV